MFWGYPLLYSMDDGDNYVVIIMCNNNNIAVLLHSFILVLIVLYSVYVNKDCNWRVIDIA